MPSGVVHQIEDFLPPKLAEEWHEKLAAEWRKTMVKPDKDSPFLFTNNDAGSNSKMRSNDNIEQRRSEVQAVHKRGHFAYAKWELGVAHPMVKATYALMQNKAVRSLLAKVSGATLTEIADFFVTAYHTGDFLSIHNDGNSGSQAWIINLSKDWSNIDGGELQFTCRDGKTFVPKYNSLVMFETRPSDLPHTVLPVRRTSGLPRFAMTGWYMSNNDRFTDAEKKQNDLMRKRL